MSVINPPCNPNTLKCQVCVNHFRKGVASFIQALAGFFYGRCTFSLWVLSSKTLLQAWPSWLTVTENSVTIIWVSMERAPWVTTPVIRFTLPKSTCSHSWGLLFWGRKDKKRFNKMYSIDPERTCEKDHLRSPLASRRWRHLPDEGERGWESSYATETSKKRRR